jgi:hypothetical protein
MELVQSNDKASRSNHRVRCIACGEVSGALAADFRCTHCGGLLGVGVPLLVERGIARAGGLEGPVARAPNLEPRPRYQRRLAFSRNVAQSRRSDVGDYLAGGKYSGLSVAPVRTISWSSRLAG